MAEVVNEKNGVIVGRLNKLRSLGVKIELDDFIPGYSSINTLGYLPFNRLKIDRAFITKFEKRAPPANATDLMVWPSRKTAVHTQVEGIARLQQSEFLRAMACNEAKGYPIPTQWRRSM
ncbi:EAL domain-containing protein [Labrenzia sp. PHM005]|uniref:EAL domain-containing protein n=1 Tax=Labrenzia sp. PHM005 TaxID=2590016 RepID=UPI00114058A1|nr:EAL domain-containing protein [Labrenzia sp. PHM005]QDG76390.1 EAL domain-containing protein [Labrenzia sp. PHM005]